MKLFTFLLLFCSCGLRADIVVIGNLDNKLKSMSKKEVEEIFMGRTRLLPNGSFALPLDCQDLRSDFYSYLTDRPIEQINAYWARILFTGQASPPIKLIDSHAVIKVVSENKGAIGYIRENDVGENKVRILFILK